MARLEVQKAPSNTSELSKVEKTSAAPTSNKDKQISAKVNKEMYTKFTMINKTQGLSNNSALNMIIISQYVRKKEEIIK